MTVYTTRGCRPCAMVKSFLDDRGLEYREIDLTDVEDPAAEIAELTGGAFVTPVVVVGSRVGIGYDPDWLDDALPAPEGGSG